MRILRLEDRYRVKLGEVIVTIAPLSGSQKLEMTSMIKQSNGLLVIDKVKQELFLVKHSVKALEGVKDLDDKDYQLTFQEGTSALTDECAEEVLSFLANTWFTHAATNAIQGLFGEVVNPYNNQVVEGVTVERLVKKEDEKK